MNTITKANDTLLSRYCAFRAGLTHLMHVSKNNDAGQGSIEYVGLLLIVGMAMALGSGILGKAKDAVFGSEGPMAGVIKQAVKAGLEKALHGLGVSW